jgi:hypothetical protein
MSSTKMPRRFLTSELGFSFFEGLIVRKVNYSLNSDVIVMIITEKMIIYVRLS